jgi:hypothetical protein
LASPCPKGAPACRLAQPCKTSGSGKFSPQSANLPAIDIVVIAKGGVKEMDNEALFKLLEKLWRTLSRRCNG